MRTQIGLVAIVAVAEDLWRICHYAFAATLPPERHDAARLHTERDVL